MIDHETPLLCIACTKPLGFNYLFYMPCAYSKDVHWITITSIFLYLPNTCLLQVRIRRTRCEIMLEVFGKRTTTTRRTCLQKLGKVVGDFSYVSIEQKPLWSLNTTIIREVYYMCPWLVCFRHDVFHISLARGVKPSKPISVLRLKGLA